MAKDSPANGVVPASISYRMTPSDHTSARASTVRLDASCSGDM